MKPNSSADPVGGVWCLQYAYPEALDGVPMCFGDAVEAMRELGIRVRRSFSVTRRRVSGVAKLDVRTGVRRIDGHEMPTRGLHLSRHRTAARRRPPGHSCRSPAWTDVAATCDS